MPLEDFPHRLARRNGEVNEMLATILDDSVQQGETCRPDRLLAAMRHAALNGGKRLRPFLLLETAEMFGITGAGPLRAAAALECLHCYSLVHDDLPAMDDDDLRRGQPTVHRAFDEATAILAGDALLTLSFDILADDRTSEAEGLRARLVLHLARAAGLGGMVGGQMLDILGADTNRTEAQIRRMQSMKTGALLRFACQAGALMGSANEKELRSVTEFGRLIGEAFQLADDILDVTSNTAALGKGAAKDADQGKATLVELLGLEESRKQANDLLEAALAQLEPFRERARWLRDAARFVVERNH